MTDILNGIPPPNAPSPSQKRATARDKPSLKSMLRGNEEEIQITIPTSQIQSTQYMSPQTIATPTMPSPAYQGQMLSMIRGKHEVLVGTPIKPDHVNYVLMYDMLTGIRIAVSRSMARSWREVVDADYETAHKLAFDMYVSFIWLIFVKNRR